MIITKPVEVQLDCGAWARLEPADQLQIVKALAIATATAVLLPNWQPHGHSANCAMLN